MRSVDSRLRARMRVDGDCWLWTGQLDRGGYGKISINSRTYVVHRVAYEHWVGPIADGLQIDHLCRVRACIRPDHLETVTPQVNTHRSLGPSGINAVKTHCDKGHEFTPDNIDPSDAQRGRRCLICRRDGVNRRSAERSERAVADLREGLPEISAALTATGRAWAAAGRPTEGPEFDAREAAWRRLHEWNTDGRLARLLSR